MCPLFASIGGWGEGNPAGCWQEMAVQMKYRHLASSPTPTCITHWGVLWRQVWIFQTSGVQSGSPLGTAEEETDALGFGLGFGTFEEAAASLLHPRSPSLHVSLGEGLDQLGVSPPTAAQARHWRSPKDHHCIHCS